MSGLGYIIPAWVTGFPIKGAQPQAPADPTEPVDISSTGEYPEIHVKMPARTGTDVLTKGLPGGSWLWIGAGAILLLLAAGSQK